MKPPGEMPRPVRKEVPRPVEKPQGKEAERKPDVEALVVLGKNWRGETGNLPTFRALSIESRIGAMAAGILYEKGSIGKVVFTGGKTKEGMPSEASAMAEYLKKRFPKVPEGDIILEEESIDTRDNAEKTAKLLTDHGIQEAAVMTFGYHTGRAERVFDRFGFDVQQVFSSEEIAAERSVHARAMLERFAQSGHVKTERLREGFLKATSLFDKKERIPRFFASRVAKRQGK